MILEIKIINNFMYQKLKINKIKSYIIMRDFMKHMHNITITTPLFMSILTRKTSNSENGVF